MFLFVCLCCRRLDFVVGVWVSVGASGVAFAAVVLVWAVLRVGLSLGPFCLGSVFSVS